MVIQYTNAGHTDMCQGIFWKISKSPYTQLPNYQTFATVEWRLRTHRLAPETADNGRQGFIRVPKVEDEILERIGEDQKLSTRKRSNGIGVSKNVVNRVTKEQLLYLYQKKSLQDLSRFYAALRLAFCRFINGRTERDVHFSQNILFFDEMFH